MATSSITEAALYTHPNRRSMVIRLSRIPSQLDSLHPQRNRTTLITKLTTKEGTPRCHLLCSLICLATTNGRDLLRHRNSDRWISTRRLQTSIAATTQGILQIKFAILPRPQMATLRLRNSLTAAMEALRMVCSSRSRNIVILLPTCRNRRQTVNSSRANHPSRRPLLLTRG